MVFPDYNDFIAHLTPEMISDICNDVNQKTSNFHGPQAPANRSAIAAFTISLELLGTYHKWLEQHFENQ